MKWAKVLRAAVVLLHFAALYLISISIWGQDRYGSIVQADGEGYYSYLPGVFIHHDLDESWNRTVAAGMSRKQNYYLDFRAKQGDKMVNRYYCGAAICMMPFFLLSHAYVKISGEPADGYSFSYFRGLLLGACFYSALGLYLMLIFLQRRGASLGMALLCGLLMTWGSNVFFYTAVEASMSHIYSFAVISAFLLQLDYFVRKDGRKGLILLGLILALVILIRPVNGIVILLLPFMAGSLDKLKIIFGNLFRRKSLPYLGFALLSAFALLFIQFILYKLQTGRFLVDSYQGYTFNFSHPHFLDFLVSYKKGWFVYTPLAFVASLGLIRLYRENRFSALSLLGFILLLWYILSSWFDWWYGGSFSQRPMVDFMGIWIFLLYCLLKGLRPLLMIPVVILCVFLVYVNQIQAYQCRKGILHWEDMTREQYWDIFLEVKPDKYWFD